MNAVADKHIGAELILPTIIGAAFGGGFYAGTFGIEGQKYLLIVAPKGGGEVEMAWSPDKAMVEGARHYGDGRANTIAMAAAGSKLAAWALGLDVGGLTDWYIPSRDELELMYRNLKPTERENYASYRDGENGDSIPPGYAYSETVPAVTSAEQFKAGGAEALEPRWYWSSSQHASCSSYAWYQYFHSGNQNGTHKSYEGRARAVRRFAI